MAGLIVALMLPGGSLAGLSACVHADNARLGCGLHGQGRFHQPGLHLIGAALQGEAKLGGHFHGALVAVFGVLFHGHHAHMDDGGGHIGGDGLDGRGLSVQVLHGHGHGAVPIEGHASGEHFVKHHAAAVNIAASVRRLTAGLLGAEIMDGAHNAVALGQRGAIRHAGDAEIRDLDVALGVDEDILGLDVPVDNAVLVGVLEGRQNADGDLCGGLRIQAAFFMDQIF